LFKGKKYEDFFYIDYDSSDIHDHDEIKEEQKNSDDNKSIIASGLSLFPIDKEIIDEDSIILKIEIREVKIIKGKSTPSPENMKKMMEDILLRFQDCLE
ncbi:hypothetical protein JW926_01445, partial [Candidatus Sumerlaeota bacterium]|nr:hypothetical protein [Candidatus Sumerlaeota bacterium]